MTLCSGHERIVIFIKAKFIAVESGNGMRLWKSGTFLYKYWFPPDDLIIAVASR